MNGLPCVLAISAVALAIVARPARSGDDADVAARVAALATADAARREEAVAALGALRADDAPALVAAVATSADERVWTGLASALAKWDGTSAPDALSRLRPEWSAASRARLDRLVHDLRMARPLAPAPEIGASPPEVAAAVRAALAKHEGSRSFGTNNAESRAIEELGRDAIPALVAALRERPADDFDPVALVAAESLGRLARDEDAPVLAHLLLSGRPAAARAFGGVSAPVRLEAFVVAIERDAVSHDLLAVLDTRSAHPRLVSAVLGFVERQPEAEILGGAAAYLAAARADAAVPTLVRALALAPSHSGRAHIAAALARLGDKDGIAALVEIAATPGDAWARHTAADALNEVVGRRVYTNSYDLAPAEMTRNFDAAAREFRSWWKANAGTVQFDRDLRRWRSAEAPAFDFGPNRPETAARVREILAPYEGRRSVSGFEPAETELAELGHDAVPELLRILSESGSARRSENYAVKRVAVQVLLELLDEDDVPRIARLLASGTTALAPALESLHSAAVRDALLGALANGFADYDVVTALQPYAPDPAVQAAALKWLQASSAGDQNAGRVAALLDGSGGEPALATLRTMMAGRVDSHSRAAVAASVARHGGKDGIEALVTMAASGTREAPDALQELNRIAGRKVYGGQHTPRGYEGNVDEAVAWFQKWWEASRDTLTYNAAQHRWRAGDAAAAIDAGTSPPEIEVKVASILASAQTRTSFFDGPERRELVALGRAAIPALVARIRAAGTDRYSSGRAAGVAAKALGDLRTDADLPLLVSLLREGHLEVAGSLKGCRDPRARDALLAVVAQGSDEHEVMRTLATIPADAATWEAVRAWLRSPRSTPGYWLGDYLEENATPGAALALREILAADGIDSVVRSRCAAALVRIGERDGIAHLISLVDAEPFRARPDTHWTTDAREIAALRLNSVVGERIFSEPDDDASAAAACASAAGRFRAWWSGNAERLAFDSERRVWVVGGSPRRPAAPPAGDGDRAFDAQVQEILLRLHGADMFSSGSSKDVKHLDPHTRELIALGHDAFPALVRALRSSTPWPAAHEPSTTTAVADALCVLATDADRATMRELLAEGRLSVADWFQGDASPESRDAILGVVARGFVTSETLRALKGFSGDRRVHEALAGWALTCGDVGPWFAQELAEILGVPAPGTTEPVVKDLLDRRIPPRVRWRIAAELAQRGCKPAFSALITAFGSPTGLTQDDVAAAGAVLNTLTGTQSADITKDTKKRGFALPEVGPELVRSRRTSWVARDSGIVTNHQEAAARFRTWWAEHGEGLRFSDHSGRWRAAD